MNNQTQEALKMLDAMRLSYSDLIYNEAGFEKAEEFEDAIIAVKEAIATNEECSVVQSAQEPVAWMSKMGSFTAIAETKKQLPKGTEPIPLYTHPHQWQGLTGDEITEIYEKSCPREIVSMQDFARAIEQALKEKNT
jgi:hypothetical protein